MTAALLVLLVVVAIVAATLTVRPSRKVHPVSLSRIDVPGAERPPVFTDDPDALDYVPEPLRPFYDPAPLDRLDVREACDAYGTRARRDVAVATGDPGLAVWRSTLPSWRRGDVPRPGEWREHAYGAGEPPPLTDVETARAVHLTRLDRAAAAHAGAATEDTAAVMRERYRCPVCGAQKGATVPTLCTACGDVADALARDEAAARILADGRTRAVAVRDWLDRH